MAPAIYPVLPDASIVAINSASSPAGLLCAAASIAVLVDAWAPPATAAYDPLEVTIRTVLATVVSSAKLSTAEPVVIAAKPAPAVTPAVKMLYVPDCATPSVTTFTVPPLSVAVPVTLRRLATDALVSTSNVVAASSA